MRVVYTNLAGDERVIDKSEWDRLRKESPAFARSTRFVKTLEAPKKPKAIEKIEKDLKNED